MSLSNMLMWTWFYIHLQNVQFKIVFEQQMLGLEKEQKKKKPHPEYYNFADIKQSTFRNTEAKPRTIRLI